MRFRISRVHLGIGCFAACIGLSAMAQSPPAAWRCGNTYTDQPCPGGKAVTANDAPSAAQVRDADSHTRQVQADAQRMEHERMRSERAHGRQSGLVHIPRPTTAAATPEQLPPKSQKKKGRKDSDFFTAAGPGTGTAKKKVKAAKTDAGS